MTDEQFIEKIVKEPMYFLYDYEDCVVKTEPVNDEIIKWVKFKGKPEFLAHKDSSITHEAIQKQNVITKEEYLKH